MFEQDKEEIEIVDFEDEEDDLYPEIIPREAEIFEYKIEVEGDQVEFALLECPHCAGYPYLVPKINQRTLNPYYYAECQLCHARSASEGTNHQCPQSAIRKVVKAWNRRVSDD